MAVLVIGVILIILGLIGVLRTPKTKSEKGARIFRFISTIVIIFGISLLWQGKNILTTGTPYKTPATTTSATTSATITE